MRCFNSGGLSFIILAILFFGCGTDEYGEGYLYDNVKHDGSGESTSCDLAGTPIGQNIPDINDLDGGEGLYSATSNRYLAQPFFVNSDVELWGIELYMEKVGTIATNIITVTIHEPDDFFPGLAFIGSGVISTNDVPAMKNWVVAEFSIKPNLTPGKLYWIQLNPGYPRNASNYTRWWYDNSTVGAMIRAATIPVWSNTGYTAQFRLLPCSSQ